MNLNALAGSLALALQDSNGGSFWLPPRNSTAAAEVDWVFYLIFWISLFFFVLIVGLMIYFTIRYRRRSSRSGAERAPHHSTALEVVWTVIPIGLTVLMFWGGFKAFLNLTQPPANATTINVTAKKWSWWFDYPNGYGDSTLHVPVNTPVQLQMTSQDVIHSFYIPTFRVKKDVVPGRITSVWFEATETGQFNVFCTEYCGTGHSDMITTVTVHEPAEYAAWLEKAGSLADTMPPADAGEYLYTKYGCNQCHTTDGSASTGPSFLNSYGYEHLIAGGTTVTVNEDYIHESILDPQAKIRDGYQGVMPTFQGKIKESEIFQLIAYMKYLSDKVSPEEKELLKQDPPEEGEAEGEVTGEAATDSGTEATANSDESTAAGEAETTPSESADENSAG